MCYQLRSDTKVLSLTKPPSWIGVENGQLYSIKKRDRPKEIKLPKVRRTTRPKFSYLHNLMFTLKPEFSNVCGLHFRLGYVRTCNFCNEP